MIKEAIEKVLELGPPVVLPFFDRDYSDKKLHLIPSPNEMPVAPLQLVNLTSLCDLATKIHTGDEDKDDFIAVLSPREVYLYGRLLGNNTRHVYAIAKCGVLPFKFGEWIPLENFIVSLQTQFVQTETTDAIIGMLGNVAHGIVKTDADDGFSQSIEVKTGITTKAEKKVTNPVELIPYRTFLEVDQIPTPCILRLKNASVAKDAPPQILCSLWTADGGLWEVEAVKRIGKYIKYAIGDSHEVIF